MTANVKVRLPQGGDRLEIDAAAGGAITPGSGIQAGPIPDMEPFDGAGMVQPERETVNAILAALRNVGIIAGG